MIMPDPRSQVAAAFNRVAAGYDNSASRFFPFCADRLIVRLNPARGSKILDVATGTGVVAMAAMQAVGHEGRVMAIDLAEGMLDRLQEKIDKFGILNIDLHVMDAAALEFRREYFDHVVCSFGIFFLPDMSVGLREWARVTKPGGRILFTVFGKQAFRPMMELFIRRIENYGVDAPDKDTDTLFAAMRLADPERCRDLLSGAGLKDIEVHTEQLGYHLKDEAEWWEVIWNSDMREWVERIPSDRQESFRAEHLADVRPLMGEQGLWLNVETLFAAGTKPSGV
jgi:ubiquinone/menaquinone biosynthesis C-methylase UbiE